MFMCKNVSFCRKIPLVRSLNESELEYSKRFFKKHGISNCNINLILDNFKNIYLYLKELHDINVYQSFLQIIIGITQI